MVIRQRCQQDMVRIRLARFMSWKQVIYIIFTNINHQKTSILHFKEKSSSLSIVWPETYSREHSNVENTVYTPGIKIVDQEERNKNHVRCCKHEDDGTNCKSPLNCANPRNKRTFKQAELICSRLGFRLCSPAEHSRCIIYLDACNSAFVWTLYQNHV